MIDTDDPQHWPGDSGAIIDAHTPTILARMANETLRKMEAARAGYAVPVNIRALLAAEPYAAVSTRQYPDCTYVSQLP